MNKININKILSKILVFTFMVNTIFSTSFLTFPTLPFISQVTENLQEYVGEQFVEEVSAANDNNLISWQKSLKMQESEFFNPQTTGVATDNSYVYFIWNVATDGYSNNDLSEGTYTLTYPIQDGYQIDFVFEKISNSEARITYYTNGTNEVNGANFQVYDSYNGIYKAATSTNFPKTDASEVYVNIPDDAEDGIATHIDFYITPGNGFAFNFGGRTIMFAWTKESNQLLFQTNGITPGNVYPFNLQIETVSSNKVYTEISKIFTGINTTSGFNMQPFANGDPASVDPDIQDDIKGALPVPTDGKDVIDQTERPIQEYPGANIVGINLTLDTPKEWVSNMTIEDGVVVNNGSFEFLEYDPDEDEPVEFKLYLAGKSTQNNSGVSSVYVTIDNIYESYFDSDHFAETGDLNVYMENSKVAANYEYHSNKTDGISTVSNTNTTSSSDEPTPIVESSYVDVFSNYNPYKSVSSNILDYSELTVTMGNLVASTIYGMSTLAVDSTAFDTKQTEFASGAIYTYPKYRVIALDENEFYLEITPYEEYNGYYLVKQGLTETTTEWALYEDTSYGTNTILITVPLDSSSGEVRFFDLVFSTVAPSSIPGVDDIIADSQTLIYKPEEEDVALGTLSNFEIISSYILYDEDDPAYTENLFLSVKWDIGTETTISTLAQANDGNLLVDYQLYKGTEVNNYDEYEFAGIQLEFTVDTNVEMGDIKNGIVYHSPEFKQDGSKHLSTVVDADIVGNTSTKTFTSSRIENVGGKDRTILEVNATFKIPVSEKYVSIDKLILEYPELYLVNVGGSYTIYPESGTEQSRVIDRSLPDTLTLNGLSSIMLAMPQTLKISDYDETYLSVMYETLNYKYPKDLLYNYDQIMLSNIGRELTDDSICYDFFITQDKNLFDNMILAQENGKDFREEFEQDLYSYDLNEKSPTENGLSINVSSLKSTSGDNLLDVLRSQKIVELSNVKQNFGLNYQEVIISGLDRNETYYIVAETKIIPFKISTGEKLEDREDYSELSNIVTATTLQGDNDLTDDNKIPAAPTNFISKDLSQSSANLLWDIPVEVEDASSDGVLEYQFIKTLGYQLDDSFLQEKVAYEKAWDNISTENKYGFRTSGIIINKFDDDALEFETSSAPISEYRYINYADNTREIKDLTLSPNTIYFYYVRTVRVTDGEDQAYSVWVPLTLTTPNVQTPENLKIEYDEDFDGYTETVFSFTLPQMDLEDVGTVYRLEYAIREDMADWVEGNIILPSSSNATITVDPVTEEIKVMYKVTNLEPGTSYKFKVRLYNTELDSYSMYSNEVEYRTEYDNDAGLEDEKVENWEDALEEKIENLSDASYWTMENSFTSTKVYYRPQYFDDIINFTNGSLISLNSGQENTFKQIYLPASAVTSAFSNFKGFKLTNGDMDVIISAQAIDPSSILAIKELTEEIARLDSDLDDYFVKITLTFEYTYDVMENQYNTSPIVGVYLDIMATNDDIVNMDERMLAFIYELAKTERYTTEYEATVREMIQNDVENIDIARYLSDTVAEFTAELSEAILDDISDITELVQDFVSVPKNIMITNPTEMSYTYKGYKETKLSSSNTGTSGSTETEVEKEWISTELRDYLEKKAIYTTSTGRYAFVSNFNTIQDVGSIDSTGAVVDIYSTYNLNNYIGYNGSVNLADIVTRDAALGTFASLADCPSGTAPTDYFASKGVALSTRDGSTPITLEETIYVAMKVYEIKTNTSVDQLKVRNYNLSSGITNVNSKYKKSIQVAFDLGVTGASTSSTADARSNINAAQLLEMSMNLSKITNI